MTGQVNRALQPWVVDDKVESMTDDGVVDILRAALSLSSDTLGMPQTLSAVAAWMMTRSDASPGQDA
jgi:hypothetical protein